ncbi:hypothetical protein A4G16_08940 [Mannheimia granulomatis]|uniref:Uncharacterized protein n=1 Tax=Mannheimia granulomatis TaxID=85402 RepID=A0A6G8JJV8_9PAST|nr:hypothetical protein [Mannheimia granulomatis]QIM67475.1 hypothetical protein A4G16_08940 [Mannheimia granulomatis]
MWEKIGVSLGTYILVIIVYGVISYFWDLDGKLSFFITEILRSNISLDVVKFFLFNISTIMLSERFYNKPDSKENVSSSLKEKHDELLLKLNNINDNYNKLDSIHRDLKENHTNLEKEYEKLKEEYGNLKQNLIIIMQDYSAIFVNLEVRAKIHQKMIKHLESIKSHLSTHEIKAIENNYINIQDIVNNFANRKEATLDQIKSSSFNKIGL